MNIIVTGVADFIGSAVVRTLLAQGSADVVVLDKLSYAGSMDSLARVANICCASPPKAATGG